MFTELDYRILEFVLQSSDPVPSHQLAMACDVSVNTVRTEIDLLNQELDTHGICIRMKRSSGVSMEILDPTAARPWLHQMRDAVIRNRRLRRKYSERVYSMARIILCAKDGITVERLEQIFYVSRGTILADIKNVRALLQMFRLELLNRRGGHGFTVQGSEWLIRQCLLQLHKNYTVTADSGKTESLAHERSFRAMFFMDAPQVYENPSTNQTFVYFNGSRYNELSALLQREILAQHDFSLPIIHFPKIINMLLLCVSRKSFATEKPFSAAQQEQLSASAEYAFVRRLHQKMPEHFRQNIQEPEMLMLTALLLGFEDENYRLGSSVRGRDCSRKAEEFVRYLQRYFGYEDTIFDESFYQSIAAVFYRLQNQREFSVINDYESTGGVSSLGIGTGNLCLAFARFFEQSFGYALEPRDALESFYILNATISCLPHYYYRPRILVVSEFGASCARAVSKRLQKYYADQLETVEACGFQNLFQGPLKGWDLILTDMSRKKVKRYLEPLGIPTLPIEFSLQYDTCPELDIWLETHCQEQETAVLNDHCFFRTELSGKEEVFRWLEQHLADAPELKGLSLSEELRHSDRLLSLERENNLVFLPVLLSEATAPRVAVLINDHAFVWKNLPAQIFVFYEHPRSRTGERILSVILHKLLYMPPQTRTALLDRQLDSPLLALYPNE